MIPKHLACGNDMLIFHPKCLSVFNIAVDNVGKFSIIFCEFIRVIKLIYS